MRKYKFITGTVSLTLAVAVGMTSFAQMSGFDNNDVLVYEYETNTSEAVVEKSANEVNVLMDSGMPTKTGEISFGFESGNIFTDETNNEDTSIKNEQTESESKENTKKKKQKNTKKKNSNKKSKKSKNNKRKNLGTYKITAYCGCTSCCGKSDGITASGTKAKEGRTIAADTSVLPFGTKVVINGKTYTVEDRGGAINGNRIDVYFKSHSDALRWGVKYLKVYKK